jgi:hypothetical protein
MRELPTELKQISSSITDKFKVSWLVRRDIV